MAFHPFRMFRKHQKAWLAGITIMAMVSFVFCSGGMDVFTRFFGGRNARGRSQGGDADVVKLYGKSVTHQDVNEVRINRQIANTFMAQATSFAQQKVFGEAFDAVKDLRFMQQPLQEIMFHHMLRGMGSEQRGQLQTDLFMLKSLRDELERQKKSDAAQKFDAVAELVQRGGVHRPNELYFGGDATTQGSLDFLIWKHQADQLGVRLDDAALKSEVKRLTFGKLTSEDMQQLQIQLDMAFGKGRIDREALYAALREEFRVRMAKQALLGYEPGAESWKEGVVNDVPDAPTPYDFWRFYRDNRTTVRVALMPVPVEKFLDQVTEKPAEVELRRLFNQYKDQEPSPEREKPGFKEPRRIKVEWISANSDSPYYQKVAALVLDLNRVLMPGYAELALIDRYNNSKFQYRLPPLGDPSFPLAIYAMKPKPADVAALVGEFLGSAGTCGLPLSAVATYQAASYSRAEKESAATVAKEAKDRALNLAQIFLNADPLTAASAYDAANRKERVLPFEAVKDLVLDQMKAATAHASLRQNIETIGKELQAKRSKPEEAKAYVEKVVKELGFTKHGETETLRDRFDIGDDPALKPLKEEYLRRRGTDDPRGRGFADSFFGPPNRPQTGLYDAQEMNMVDATAPVVFWRTDDKPAFVPKKFEDVKAKVEAAWKLQKARALAKKFADEIAAKAKDAKGEAGKVLIEEAYKHPDRGLVFELDNVALLLPKKQPFETADVYEPYKVPETQIAYPRPNTAEKFLSLKDPGETTVIADRPEAIYYVVALVKRSVPTEREFYDLYRRTPTLDTLRARLEQERRSEYISAFMKHLRAEAGEVDSEGNLVIAEDQRKNADSRSDEG